MPRTGTLKHIGKAGAFAASDLKAREIGVNTSDKRLSFSTDGADVNTVYPGLPPEKVAFAGVGAIPIPFDVARTIAAPTVFKDAGSPTFTYQYAATPGAALSAATFPLNVAAGSWLVVTCTSMSTATLVGLIFPVS